MTSNDSGMFTDAERAREAARPAIIRISVEWAAGARTAEIPAADYYGGRGASPMHGETIISAIERMVRQGPPPEERRRGS
jgi:hypothetical protein